MAWLARGASKMCVVIWNVECGEVGIDVGAAR